MKIVLRCDFNALKGPTTSEYSLTKHVTLTIVAQRKLYLNTAAQHLRLG